MTIVTQVFESLFKSTIRAKGYPHLPFIVMPHPFDHLPEADIRGHGKQRLRDLVRALTVGQV